MHTILVRVCPDRKTKEKPIQRVMCVEGPVPAEGGTLRIPALGRPLVVLLRPRNRPADAECAVWCTGRPYDIAFLRGVEPEWEQVSCMTC